MLVLTSYSRKDAVFVDKLSIALIAISLFGCNNQLIREPMNNNVPASVYIDTALRIVEKNYLETLDIGKIRSHTSLILEQIETENKITNVTDIMDQAMQPILSSLDDTSAYIRKMENGQIKYLSKQHIKKRIVKNVIVDIQLKYLSDGILYLRLPELQNDTVAKLYGLLDSLSKNSEKQINGFVFDLRDNTGGQLSAVIDVSNAFINRGKIAEIKGRSEDAHLWFTATPRVYLSYDIPLVIIVNGGTASGAELIVAALQKYRGAIIIGSATDGSRKIQTIFPIASDAFLNLTTGTLYLAGGEPLTDTGIQPDVCIAHISGEIKNYQYPGPDPSRQSICPKNNGNHSDNDALSIAINLLRSKK